MWLYTTAQKRNGLVLTDTQAAIDYMYANGLTKFSTTQTFMANNSLRRDEAAAFFARFARDVLGIVPDTTKAECNNFVDLYLWHQDLVGEMIAACQLWLIKGSNGKFMPRDTFSNAHAVTVIVRLLDGDQSETGPHRGSNYLNRARTLWLTNGLSLDRIGIASDWSNLDKSITRGDVAKLIEAWSVQWLGLKNIDYTQQWTTTTQENYGYIKNAYIMNWIRYIDIDYIESQIPDTDPFIPTPTDINSNPSVTTLLVDSNAELIVLKNILTNPNDRANAYTEYRGTITRNEFEHWANNDYSALHPNCDNVNLCTIHYYAWWWKDASVSVNHNWWVAYKIEQIYRP